MLIIILIFIQFHFFICSDNFRSYQSYNNLQQRSHNDDDEYDCPMCCEVSVLRLKLHEYWIYIGR